MREGIVLRDQADSHKQAVTGHLCFFPAGLRLYGHAAEKAFLCVQRSNLYTGMLFHVRPGEKDLLQLLLSGKVREILQHDHLFAFSGKQDCLLQCGIAAAGHTDGLPGIEIPVAHRAETDSLADQLVFTRQAQHPMLHARGYDHSLRVPFLTVIGENPLEIAMILNPDHFRQVHFRSLGHDLVQQGFRVFVAAHLRRARPVLHLGAVGDLAAEAMLLQHQGALAVPLRIQRGGHSRGTSADHNDISHFSSIL